ncbi:MAG: hypothetical protein R3D63_11000 [Paracoccaceae bacterium]
MFRAVEVPLWLLVLIVGFAAVSFATHFLFPRCAGFFGGGPRRRWRS